MKGLIMLLLLLSGFYVRATCSLVLASSGFVTVEAQSWEGKFQAG